MYKVLSTRLGPAAVVGVARYSFKVVNVREINAFALVESIEILR